MTLYLIRHTEVLNPFNLCYGQMDIALLEPIEPRIQGLKSQLKDLKIDRVYCSESSRTQILAEKLGYKYPVTDRRLNEIYFGEWEGIAWKDIPKDPLDRWMYDYKFQKPPGGENYPDLMNRVQEFHQELLDLFLDQEKNILVLSHSGTIRSFLSLFLKLNIYQAISWEIPFGSIWKINLHKKRNPIVYFSKR